MPRPRTPNNPAFPGPTRAGRGAREAERGRPGPPGRLLRSLGAGLAGTLAVVVPSIGTDVLMNAAGVLPAPGQPLSDAPLLLATLYRTAYGVAGSYVAARLAPGRPMAHALALGVIGFVMSLLGAVVTWGKPPAAGHEWYPLALVVLAIPTAWLGGRLGSPRLRPDGPEGSTDHDDRARSRRSGISRPAAR